MKRIIGVQQEIDGFYMDGEEGRAGAVYISTCGSILISVEAWFPGGGFATAVIHE
jgi:hypothetical protein